MGFLQLAIEPGALVRLLCTPSLGGANVPEESAEELDKMLVAFGVPARGALAAATAGGTGALRASS